MTDCLFCKIIEGSIPSKKVFEDELILAFHDINKATPTHIIIIPKKHIKSANEIDNSDSVIIGHIFNKAKEIAKSQNISEDGYRIVNNCGVNGGQTVSHLHFHLLGGRILSWPPG